MGASLFLVWLAPATALALHDGRSAALVLTFTVLYGGAFLVAWWLGVGWRPPGRIVLIAALYALGVGYVLTTGDSPAELGYAVGTSVLLMPMRWSRIVGLSCVVAVGAVTWTLTRTIDWASCLELALVTMLTLNINRMARLVGRLHAAQAEIRTLAVADERARLARDLHDILGHSLTTITVKTSLSRRLLEKGAPAERVLEEIRDTEELSRRALADIRATVSAQRQMSLAGELASAGAALRAAGIEADLPHAVDDVAAGLEVPLAYVLREGVTNVVRHSGARRCTVRLGPRWLEIRDDGSGARVERSTPGPGNGLTGLAERLAAVHGTVESGPLPSGGFRLRAEVPAWLR
ncbi:MAG: sensor histidine kinase [Pseudonocardia sp.]|nr:sensor histidine kinase [Pseudonocardia sp.]